VKAYILNLVRRPDRLAHMKATLPSDLTVEFTTDWDAPIDGQAFGGAVPEGFAVFPWRIESDNQFWSRPLRAGEVGCAIGHWSMWRRAAADGDHPALFLEDDTVLVADFLSRLEDGLARLAATDPSWDLVYLGRHALEPDTPVAPGIVRPGFSYCTYGYAVSALGVQKLLATNYDQALLPPDELLPALYLNHPRPDIRARYPRSLAAYAFEPPLVTQLPRDAWGTDTEDSDDVR
jgi:collagen beta-1,O-galactosyltransferase